MKIPKPYKLPTGLLFKMDIQYSWKSYSVEWLENVQYETYLCQFFQSIE